METTLTGWRELQVDRLRLAADLTVRGPGLGRWDAAAEYLETAVRITPDDGSLWNELAGVRLAWTRERAAPEGVAAVAGPVALLRPPDLPSALKAARAARNRLPLLPGPHLRLGTYAHLFVRGEPAAVHFERAKRVAAFDPDVWYLSGAAALDRGDLEAAWADWREALRRSPRRVGLIARQAVRFLPPEQVRARILPDDPGVWMAATADLFPDPQADPKPRQDWLRAAANRWEAGPRPDRPAGWVAWASALEELGDRPAALKVLRTAADQFTDSILVRNELATRLEGEELYEEAVPHLEWLTAALGGRGDFQDRLAAARHGAKLRREIEGR
jgi:tetratricopeptide (TPR) repeat protein